ncbi:hypothetical protein GQ607_009358, partial [Colletotrichum asianum]
CQTSIDTHPARAPKGKTADRDEIITALYTATETSPRPPSFRTGQEQPGVLHSRVSRIQLINQGGICGSCREPRIGRIL